MIFILFYAREIDSNMLVTLNDITSAQSSGTEAKQKSAQKLLGYCNTQSNEKVPYQKNQMALHIHSDTSYLSAPKSRGKVGGHFYL